MGDRVTCDFMDDIAFHLADRLGVEETKIAAALRPFAPVAWRVKEERLRDVRRWLAERVPRALIRDRLMQSYGLSRQSAYRIISEALRTPHP